MRYSYKPDVSVIVQVPSSVVVVHSIEDYHLKTERKETKTCKICQKRKFDDLSEAQKTLMLQHNW